MLVAVFAAVGCTPEAPASQPPEKLAITTSDLPVAIYEKPYSVQLHATGAQGKLRWSLGWGSPPSSITLSEDGTLEGIIFGVRNPQMFQVTVTDPVTNATASKVLVLFAGSDTPQPMTGTALPEGTNVTVLINQLYPSLFGWGVEMTIGNFRADGTFAPLSTTSLRDYDNLLGNSLLGGPMNDVIVVDGVVRDADTGVEIRRLFPEPPDETYSWASFSRDGSYAVVFKPSVADIFDTTTWQRTGSISYTRTLISSLVWSPDSSTVAVHQPTMDTNGSFSDVPLKVYDPTGTLVREVPVGGGCTSVKWGATGRFLAQCEGGIKTFRGSDGGDVHRILTPSCAIQPTPCSRGGWAAFSPSGERVIYADVTDLGWTPITEEAPAPVSPFVDARLLVAADVDNPVPSRLITLPPSFQVAPLTWN